MKKVTLGICGRAPESVEEKFGLKIEIFNKLFSEFAIDLRTSDVYTGHAVNFEETDGLVICGSNNSANDKLEWIIEFEKTIRTAVEFGLPILGICFGHQILAKALGGKVLKNPLGWEIGSYEIQLTAKGLLSPIFKNIPQKFVVYESHQDVVVKLPESAVVLANNTNGLQAFQYNDNIFGVQFHPEYSMELMQEYKEIYKLKGVPVGKNEVKESKYSEIVLHNFIKYVLEGENNANTSI